MVRILIVDDDKDILKLTDSLLSQANYDVRTAIDPIKAMDLLNSGKFDLLITDANMPHYTGFELIKTIKNDARHRNLSIVMLTGLREKKSIQKAILAGVDDYIVKPIDPMVFLKKVADIIKKKPPEKRLELQFSSVAIESQAQLNFDINIAMISESGLKVVSRIPIPEGTLIHLDAELFKKIGIESPPLRILKAEKLEDSYELLLGFVGLSESTLEKIRAWVYSETARRRHLAA